MSAIGKRGGLKRAKIGKQRLREIGRMGGEAKALKYKKK